MPVNATALAGDRAVEEVAGVELDAGFGRRDFERPPALRLDDVARRAAGPRRVRFSTQLWS